MAHRTRGRPAVSIKLLPTRFVIVFDIEIVYYTRWAVRFDRLGLLAR